MRPKQLSGEQSSPVEADSLDRAVHAQKLFKEPQSYCHIQLVKTCGWQLVALGGR